MSAVIRIMGEDDPEEVIFSLIEHMMKKVRENILAQFKKHQFPVTRDQWIIIKQLSEMNGTTQKELAAYTLKDPAALTRILDLLEKKGLVQRRSNHKDRRTFKIYLTVEGSRLVNKMTPVVQEIKKMALNGISKKDIAVMENSLKKMHSNLA